MSSLKPKIYFTADLHYEHVNIIKGQSVWKNKNACRDFSSVEEMNKKIIESINNTVTKYDTLYILGDVAFKNLYSVVDLMKNIKCKNVYLILGNHDQSIRDNKKFYIYEESETPALLAYEFLGKTIMPNVKYEFRLKELFKDVQKRIEFKYEGQRFILDHYPLSTWNQAMHGSIMIHGHVHGALDDSDLNLYYKRIDVDWGKFQRPVSIDEIIELMKDRKNLEY